MFFVIVAIQIQVFGVESDPDLRSGNEVFVTVYFSSQGESFDRRSSPKPLHVFEQGLDPFHVEELRFFGRAKLSAGMFCFGVLRQRRLAKSGAGYFSVQFAHPDLCDVVQVP